MFFIFITLNKPREVFKWLLVMRHSFFKSMLTLILEIPFAVLPFYCDNFVCNLFPPKRSDPFFCLLRILELSQRVKKLANPKRR